MSLLEIKVIKGMPFLEPTREVTDFEFGPVTEEENSIRWIMDDNVWESKNGLHTIKIRVKCAVDLYDQIKEMSDKKEIKMDQAHWMHLASICQVHIKSTNNEDNMAEIEKSIYPQSISKLQEAIDEFNMITIFKGVS
jgi:hypothetical protein